MQYSCLMDFKIDPLAQGGLAMILFTSVSDELMTPQGQSKLGLPYVADRMLSDTGRYISTQLFKTGIKDI